MSTSEFDLPEGYRFYSEFRTQKVVGTHGEETPVLFLEVRSDDNLPTPDPVIVTYSSNLAGHVLELAASTKRLYKSEMEKRAFIPAVMKWQLENRVQLNTLESHDT